MDKAYDRLIEVGTELFSQYGYDAVSVRQIASEAQVNVSAIAYYFNGKEKFYEEILSLLAQNAKKQLSKFDIVHFATLDADAAKATLHEFLKCYQSLHIANPKINPFNIFLREGLSTSQNNAHKIYTELVTFTLQFFKKIFSIYFEKIGKDNNLVNFSLSAMFGIMNNSLALTQTISTPNANPSIFNQLTDFILEK